MDQLTLIKCTGQECENFKGVSFQDQYTIDDAVIYKDKETGEVRLMDLTLKCKKCWGEHKITHDVKNPKKHICPCCRDSKSKYNNMSVWGHQIYTNQEIIGFYNNGGIPMFKVRCLKCKDIYSKYPYALLEGQHPHRCNPEVLYKDRIGEIIADQKVLGFSNNGRETWFKVQCLKCNETYLKKPHDLLKCRHSHKCKVEVLYKDRIGEIIADHKVLGFCKDGNKTCFKVQCLRCGEIYSKLTSSLLTQQYPHKCININTDYFDESYLGKVFGLQKVIDISKDKSKSAKWTLECIECGKIKVEIASEVIGNLNQGKIPSCDCTTTSVGALYTERALKELGYNPIKEMYFGDLKDINQLRYDFAIRINEQLILIEYDGKQHITGWSNREENLEYIKSHDKMKDDYAKEHGYKLIRIDHLVPLEDIKDFLESKINAILEELNSEESTY